MVRNSDFGKKFLIGFADGEFVKHEGFSGYDNGFIHVPHIFQQYVLDILIPDAIQARENCKQIWHQANDYDSYMTYVSCVKQAIGATRLWPGKIRIYRKAHAWVRDGTLTDARYVPLLNGLVRTVILPFAWTRRTVPPPSIYRAGVFSVTIFAGMNSLEIRTKETSMIDCP
ncbi:unnamed protein product [Nippostrongylus brasiliensis]|uniref:DDE_Tnp_1_7 domain-containing protein n=1 Tax=Nippostrongylus brasiliensis TaxID=27835 RepID=A0A0N4XGU3_NIPBR|nr:unnamed protein product [Nippostrongylus brasiliensis]